MGISKSVSDEFQEFKPDRLLGVVVTPVILVLLTVTCVSATIPVQDCLLIVAILKLHFHPRRQLHRAYYRTDRTGSVIYYHKIEGLAITGFAPQQN